MASEPNSELSFLEKKEYLDFLYKKYNTPYFIEKDPISIPHRFTKVQDIEIAGFFAAIFAWGQRSTIIKKSKDLLSRMEHEPYEFVKNYKETSHSHCRGFVHRTFNEHDLHYILLRLRVLYDKYDSMDAFFANHVSSTDLNIENGLIAFHNFFFHPENALQRTKKHIASPKRKSNCKRLNMFLRWMVRTNESGVDFGLWHSISSKQLICPVDVHVERVAKTLNLIHGNSKGWGLAVSLTENLKKFDANDPVKYDIALFGAGVEKLL